MKSIKIEPPFIIFNQTSFILIKSKLLTQTPEIKLTFSGASSQQNTLFARTQKLCNVAHQK